MIQARSQEIAPSSIPVTANSSQTTAPADDVCTQRLDKTLDALEKCQSAKADVDAQLVTKNSLLAKESEYNAELLNAVALLTSSEKRNKPFFAKVREQLGRVLTAVTDPKQIAAVVSIILILDRLKK